MNRNLEGKELSTDELIQIAVDNGLLDPAKVEGMRADLRSKFRSKMNTLTQEIRFKMWSRGELILDTNPNN